MKEAQGIDCAERNQDQVLFYLPAGDKEKREQEVRKTRRIIAWILSAVLCILPLAGCQSAGGNETAEPVVQENTEPTVQQDEETGTPEEQAEVVTATRQEKARTVITTDGEVDDRDSVFRALLYANDMDIAGIVLTSSMYHYAGDAEKGIEPYRWTGIQWITVFLDAYAAVYDNLKAHDADYPSPDYLKSVTHIGNISNKGEMEEVTDGSVFLKELYLDDDPRTLYVQTYGGTNTTHRKKTQKIFRSLLTIEENSHILLVI